MSPFETTRAERRARMKRRAARALRETASDAEQRMWRHLRGKQMAMLRFRRQQPIGPYVVDFYCSAAKLIVELDGGQHGEDKALAYDAARTQWLEVRGYRVMRIWNHEFFASPDEVLERIWRTLKDRVVSLPSP
ncbi:MAG TPA: endonuclease domain-containing protein [Rhizomicrobium sp.]|jgi:adenine-specific DNA-methyltransferase